jgi:branched-chain amino acid transport system permease protein
LRARVLLAILFGGLVLLPAVAGWAGEPFWVRLVTRMLILALAALSLDLILGLAGLISFGHAAFVGVGAYVVGMSFQAVTAGGWPGLELAWVRWPLAALVAGLVALPIGALCLRTRGIAFIMITLAFAQMLYFLLTGLRVVGGQDGIALWTRARLPPFDLADDGVFYFVCLALLVVALFLAARLSGSRFGRVLRGVRENEARTAALGIETNRCLLVAFALAGALAGLAGALLAEATYFVSPAFLHWSRSGELIAVVVLGGVGTLYGPVLGAGLFLLLEELLPPALAGLHPALGEHWRIVFGPILILVVLFARRGLWGLIAGSERT